MMKEYTVSAMTLRRMLCATFLLVALMGCTKGVYLKTGPTQVSSAGSEVSLILYVTANYDGLEQAAFIDIENDPYEFMPFTSDYNYQVTRHLSMEKAVEKALNYMKMHRAFLSSEVKSIYDPGGKIAGYEVRPLYQPFAYGDPDVLDISYILLEDNRVKILLEVKQEIRNLIMRKP